MTTRWRWLRFWAALLLTQRKSGAVGPLAQRTPVALETEQLPQPQRAAPVQTPRCTMQTRARLQARGRPWPRSRTPVRMTRHRRRARTAGGVSQVRTAPAGAADAQPTQAQSRRPWILTRRPARATTLQLRRRHPLRPQGRVGERRGPPLRSKTPQRRASDRAARRRCRADPLRRAHRRRRHREGRDPQGRRSRLERK